MKQSYAQLCAGENVRASLLAIKQQLNTKEAKAKLCALCDNRFDVFMKCLVHEDAKARKNAALLLGQLQVEEAEDVLFDAYEAEDVRFVRPAYIQAMTRLSKSTYLKELKERLAHLRSMQASPEEEKHLREEIATLQEYVLAKEKSGHTFQATGANTLLLTTLPAFREALCAELPFQKTVLKGGVKVSAGDMEPVMRSRLWNEAFFVLPTKGAAAEAKAVAEALASSDLMQILEENHTGDGPFPFRVGVSGPWPKEQQSAFAKAVAAEVEQAFGGQLVNSVSHYEAELRLMIRPGAESETVQPLLKLYTLPDKRFRYRKYTTAAGRKPYEMAGLLALAKPYLKDYAQVLDAFCGTGTWLIERQYAAPVRTAYGLDIFKEAVEKARANAGLAGMPIHFINRSFFDFTHDYLFDEIFADFPEHFADRSEADFFYRRFFDKAAALLPMGGKVFVYSKERGLVKKHLRLCGEYRLLAEHTINEKKEQTLFILERKQRV